MPTIDGLDALLDCGTRVFPGNAEAWRTQFPMLADKIQQAIQTSHVPLQLGFKPSKFSAFGFLAIESTGTYVRVDYIWPTDKLSVSSLSAAENERLRLDLTGIALRHGRGILPCGLLAAVSIEERLHANTLEALVVQLQELEQSLFRRARAAEIERSRIIAAAQRLAKPQRAVCSTGKIRSTATR